nr:retrovirus-related Pol polyprotein from transposon TNT 1-94 [Tanacetum cinerariifolium]
MSKDETPEVLIDFLRLTLHAYFAAEEIQHQTSVARTPEQNGVVKRQNHTLVEAARTMLSAAKVPLFFWAKAIPTVCFTQNRSLVIPRHEKTPYHIINDQKPSVKFFYIFGSLFFIIRDGENLDKMKEKGDECIFVGYFTQSRAYRVFNKRTRVIMESIHVNFDELPQMASAHNSSDLAPTCQSMASVQISSDPAPECQTMVLKHDNLSPGRKCHENVSHGDKTGTTLNELDLLFSPMFDELLNGSSKVVCKSSAVSAADAPNERQQLKTPLNNHTTPAPTCQSPSIAPTVMSSENINQAEPHAENDQVADDEFINIFSTPVQEQGETSSRHKMASVQISSDPAPECQTMADELPQMASAHNSSDPAPTCQTMASDQISSDPVSKFQTMALKHDSLSPGRKCQENVSHGDKTGTTSNELDLLFSPMFDELLNGSSKVVSKSSAVSAADAPHKRQQLTTPLNYHTTPAPTCQIPSITPTVISSENINQAEPHTDNDEVADAEFINIFSTPVQDQGETSLRHNKSLGILHSLLELDDN